MTFAGFLCAIGLFFIAVQNPEAQTRRELEELPALRERAVVIQIIARIEENGQEIWNTTESRVTVPGRSVSIRLVGENVNVTIQFTPYLRAARYILVAQSQIWINIPERGMNHRTSNQSIPLELGEGIIYFPLGAGRTPDTPHIELLLTMFRFGEEPPFPRAERSRRGNAAESNTQSAFILSFGRRRQN